jgi:uncharacterized membrane protein (UPF0127 family)
MFVFNREVELRRLVMLMVLMCVSLSASGAAEVAGLRIGAHLVRAEVVNTESSRAQGLMHRKTLCENCGMLFVFPVAAKHRFWMKNTLIPLSIAFVSDDGIIAKIADMAPGSEQIHEGPEGIRYALEMRAGWFELNGISVGAALHDMKTLKYFRPGAE